MLMLTRYEGQEIKLDGDIRVKVYRINGNKVTIGVDAPTEVAIYRAELEPFDPGLRVKVRQEHHQTSSNFKQAGAEE